MTTKLKNLTIHDPYHGNDNVKIEYGIELDIKNIGSSLVYDGFKLKKNFHVPHITKNLLSVHKCVKDNNVTCEFSPIFCYIKE